ncbi:MAG: hypothetical protein ACR2RE_28160 [Geminicoccaceae bacterium]
MMHTWLFKVPAPHGMLAANGNFIRVEAETKEQALKLANERLAEDRADFEKRMTGK